MKHKASAMILTLLIVFGALIAGFVTYKIISKPSSPVSEEISTAPVAKANPTPFLTPTPKIDNSDAGLDIQMSAIQSSIDKVDSDQKAYLQIDQSADSVTP